MTRDITAVTPVPADAREPYGPDPNQFFDAWLPRGSEPRGAVVMIHGGFWRARYDLSHASHLCAALARVGIATASLEYRRVGNPCGGWPGSFQDVIAGFNAAAKHLSGSRNTVVVGHSAGGHLALRLACEALPMCGVVALAPVADLAQAYELNLSNGAVKEFLGGTPDDIPLAYDDACPTKHASAVPRILVHGTNDDVVPISLSQRFLKARAGDAGEVCLRTLSGAGHFDVIDPETAAWPSVVEAIRELFV